MHSLLLTVVYLTSLISASPAPSSSSQSLQPNRTEYPVRLLYQYPHGTWVENLAVRASGELLLTQFTLGRLDSLDPLSPSPSPQPIYKFANYTSAMGIAEVAPDIFTVVVGDYDFTVTGQPVAGTWGIWKANFSHPLSSPSFANASVSKILDIPSATFLDGMCVIPSSSASNRTTNSILAGDVKTGNVYYIDPNSGENYVAISNNYTAAVPAPYFVTAGLNGIHIVGEDLYFTNTGQGILGKIPVGKDGKATGDTKVLARVLNATTQYYDDFAIQGQDVYLVTGSGNSIEKVTLGDGGATSKGRIIAGSLNSTEIAEPTSCAFGRTELDKHVLYVVTGGGLLAPVNGNEMTGAQVLAIDTREWEEWAE